MICSIELQLNSDHKPSLFYKQWEKLLVLYTDCDYDTTKSGLNTISIHNYINIHAPCVIIRNNKSIESAQTVIAYVLIIVHA